MLTHKLSSHPLYRRWADMKKRCSNTKSQNYYLYGGRGIKVCEEWDNDFTKYYNWAVLNGFKENLIIDRIDVNGNYDPDNCRWVNSTQSSNNKRNSVKYLYKGESLSLSEILKNEGIYHKYGSVYFRIKHLNWTIEQAVNTK